MFLREILGIPQLRNGLSYKDGTLGFGRDRKMIFNAPGRHRSSFVFFRFLLIPETESGTEIELDLLVW